MRTPLRISLALLLALVLLPVAASAQTTADRFSLNATVGPSFANVGTTFSTTAGLDVNLNDYVDLVGEFGMLPHAPFEDATEIAPPFEQQPDRVHAYHWNGNIRVRPFEVERFSPYVTAGLGSFSADAVAETQVNGRSIQDRRRMTDFSTNVGAGLVYRVNDWIGLNADYRTFFVHRTGEDPKVHRFATGISLFLP